MGSSSRTSLEAVNAGPSPAPLVEVELPFPGWGHEEAAWDKVRSIALARLDQMMNLEVKVLRGNKPQAIHDFRVASRRFQQAFDLLSPEEPSKNLLRLRRRIARGRKALSGVRNLDVFIRRTDKILARKRAPRRRAWEAVRDYLGRRREKAYMRAARKLGKLNLARVYVRLRSVLEPGALFAGVTPEASPRANDARLGEGRFQQKLSQELTRAWESFAQAGARAEDSPEAIHSTRLAVKRLRYLMEIVHEFEQDRSGRVIALSRRLQDCLGEWHDFEVEDQILAEMAARPEFLRKHIELVTEILKLMAHNRRTKERLVARRSALLDASARAQLEASVLALAAH